MQKQTTLDFFFFTQIASYHTLPSDTTGIMVHLPTICQHDFPLKNGLKVRFMPDFSITKGKISGKSRQEANLPSSILFVKVPEV
ncbi:hypothetical protein [Victivallis sp. Marseille-Q1083]|uniref:hypothetical protein n=1 Tax=Victivallis sp. Marseille-Q1083 TaxID=2717288 RepID=UPI00158D3EEB|nr:hypothetical protein [Victivallis sp. Marseille-Q1083]